ncbi:MAG: murein biosynthesis integral membrane protein MurJ [Clostridiales bacterium]|nr:murein biosynthesis integral membrane protein MurJ [Clostridiales bacterium]
MAKSFSGAALMLMAINTAARILGFVRETVIASVFGASQYTDAYQVAYTIPYFLQMVLGVALVSSIVPVIVRSIDGGNADEGWQAASATINLTFLCMTLLAVLGALGAGPLVRLSAPGLSAEAAGMAASMTAVIFPSVIFMSIAMLITGILNACRKFAVAAFAPALASLVIILGVVLFGASRPQALPIASLLSFISMLFIQLPALRGTGFHYHWSFDYKNPFVKGVFTNLGAVFLGTATYQIYLAINRFFASWQPVGSISALNYAGKLMNMPLGIFVAAVSSSIFPLLSTQALEDNHAALWDTANNGLKLVLMITLPSAAGLMALGQPIIRLLFERGAFTPADTVMAAGALFWFGPGMGAMAATQILTRAYYALGDAKTPLFFGLSSIGVNIAASVALTSASASALLGGHEGLALANSLASLYYAGGMYIALLRRLPRASSRSMLTTLAKVLAGSAVTAASAMAAYRLSEPILTGRGTLGLLVAVGAAICAGILSFIVVIFLLKEKDLLLLFKKL